MTDQSEIKIRVSAENFKMVPVEHLVPNPKNANRHSIEQIQRLAQIIKFQGFRNPIVVSNQSGFMNQGHGRLEAAKLLGMEEVPVVYQDFESDAQEYAALIADNEIARWAQLDLQSLHTELPSLEAAELDLNMLGLEDLRLPSKEQGGGGNPDDVPGEVNHPITTKGDLWLLGDHRLLCGDSTILEDVEKVLEGKKLACLVTDPPYNIDYEGKTKEKMKIANDKMSNDDFYTFLYTVFTNCYMNSEPGSGAYVYHADTEGINFRQAFKDSGYKLAQVCIWAKNSLVMGRSDFHWQHEPCLYGWNPDGSHRWFGDRKQSTLWHFDRPQRSDLHPTMKPVALIEYNIHLSTKDGDLVFDPFLGSGTTLIACQMTGRRCHGIEFSEKYTDTIIKRWQEFTGGKAVHAETGKTYDDLVAEKENRNG